MVFLRLMRGLYCCAFRGVSTATNLNSFSANEFRKFPIIHVTKLNHDTKVLRMALPSPNSSTGMGVSSLVMVKGENDDARPYTPISLKEDLGYFELLVKKYSEGKVSSFLHSLDVGQEVAVKGPFSKLAYSPNMKKTICMLAGGSGITPCLQVIKEVIRLKAAGDKTQIRLVYANKKEEDILLRDLLDQLSATNDNLQVEYVLSRADEAWQGRRGHLDKATLQALLPAPARDVLVYVCGPPGFMEAVSGDKLPNKEQGPLRGALKEMGFSADMVYKF